MKTATVTVDEKVYKIEAMGFLTANRLLMSTIVPIIPALASAKEDIEDQEAEVMFIKVMSLLDADLVEDVTIQLLHKVTVDGETFDINEMDYELAIELLQKAVMINYKSLGKLMARLKKMADKKKSDQAK